MVYLRYVSSDHFLFLLDINEHEAKSEISYQDHDFFCATWRNKYTEIILSLKMRFYSNNNKNDKWLVETESIQFTDLDRR